MISEERLRRRYQPDRIRVLLVGESPPASGRYFYVANSGLYRAIRDTFVASQLLTDRENVREYFRDNGWEAGIRTRSNACSKLVMARGFWF
jgi:hypothetical protein